MTDFAKKLIIRTRYAILLLFAVADEQIITSLDDFVNKIQKGFCCAICTELLYQPFNLPCGHVFCYSVLISLGLTDEKCLVDWFNEAKRCPTCRERVAEKPVVSYLVTS